MKLLLLVALACGAGLALASRLPSDAELRTEPAAAGGQAASTAEAAPVFVCEAFTAKQCAEQKHCELCTRLDGLELCFSQKVAAKLPVSRPAHGVAASQCSWAIMALRGA